ncbi:MAG: prephenate dehydrogenase [bacterium]
MKIGIVGLGLMGGSIAAALKPRHRIYAYDIDPSAVAHALAKNIIDRGYAHPDEMLSLCDVVYLCLYPRDIAIFFAAHQAALSPGAIVIDIAGVKAAIVGQVLAILRSDVQFVFSHPIAGREKTGVVFSDPDIFKGANYVVVPTPGNTPESLATVHGLALEMGFRTVTDLSPEEHDAIIAYTSQLTHIISLALVNADDLNRETGNFIGDSYRDLTRIAMINAPLWSELFLENKENLLATIASFRAELDGYAALIANDDIEGLKNKMTEAKHRRARLEKGK